MERICAVVDVRMSESRGDSIQQYQMAVCICSVLGQPAHVQVMITNAKLFNHVILPVLSHRLIY